jgi:hypothetical protein
MTSTTISGAYIVGVTLSGTYNPVYFQGSVTTNSGNALTGPAGTLWTVVNSGQIDSTYAFGRGIQLDSGGSVTNQSTGSISGTYAGVYIESGLGTVSNAGMITGVSGGSGVALHDGGLVTNTTATAVINGAGGGIYANGTYATVSNLGSIIGFGPLDGGGATSTGIQLNQGGSVVNGLSGTALGLIYGYASGVEIIGPTLGTTSEGAGTVTNYGTILGHSLFGVDLDEGGVVVNGASGSPGAYIYGGGFGVRIDFSNISVPGVTNLPGTVTNYGTIKSGGSGPGVELGSSGTLVNASGALISGYYGVLVLDVVGFNSTVTNAGTMTATGPSDEAVRLSGPGDLLIVDPGAVFNGVVLGSTSILELASGASAGVLSGSIGESVGQYTGFTQITVDANADWTLDGSNTIASGETLTDLGRLYNVGTLLNDGTVDVGFGTMTVAGLVGAGAVTLGAGATLDVQGTIAGGETIMFAGNGVRLDLDAPADVAGTLAGFIPGQTIDLAGVAPGSVSYSATGGGQLDFTVTGGGSYSIALPGAGNVKAVTDHNGGSLVTALCFLRGTRIRTPTGSVRVERLAVGDMVATWSGGVRPLRWIGVGRVAATRGQRSAATPVIVRKGALADGVPARDLRVTRGHSLFIDDVLIPVEFLVNHRSIVWDDRAQLVELYHLELDSHDVLVANGAPAESYRDDGNRWLFQNANSGWDLPPQEPCAPVLTGGPIVDAAWRRLLERAGRRPDVPTTADADVHLVVDGKRLDASVRRPDVQIFELPDWPAPVRPGSVRPASVRIMSRAAAPDQLGLARDPRVLGIAVRRIMLWQDRRLRVIGAADLRLRDGYHGYEPKADIRWTDGDAGLPEEVFAGLSGKLRLELRLGGATSYVDEGVAAGW